MGRTLNAIMSWHENEHVGDEHAFVNRVDMHFGSSDTESMADGSVQTIGLRFTRVQVPADRPRCQDSLRSMVEWW